MEELINTIFYYADTLKEYTDALAEKKILSRTIVFVDETGEIYKNGKVFGSYKKLADMINQLAQETRNALDESSRQIQDLTNELRESVQNSFEEEIGLINENLENYKNRLDALRQEFDNKVIEDGDARRQIDAINGIISDYATWKSSIEVTLTTFQNTLDAHTGQMVRYGERIDTLNNSVTNFQEVIDLQNETFRQYIENYDITNKVRNILGREMMLNDGLLHDYATKTDLSQGIRNSIDVWFNSLDPSWQQLTSQAKNGQDAYTALAGFRSEVNDNLDLIEDKINSVESATTVLANWKNDNSEFISSLRNVAGDNSAYFDLSARFEDDNVVSGLASRIFGYVNRSGDSSLVLQADHIQMDGSKLTINPEQVVGLGNWVLNNVTLSKLKAISGDNWIDINANTGITNSQDGFKFNMNGTGHVAKGKLSWNSNGDLTFGNGSSISGKILSDGSGYFALNKFRWDTLGNLSIGALNPAGIKLNANGSGHIANGLISWDSAGNINITGQQGKNIIINGDNINITGPTINIEGYWNKKELTSQTIQKITNFDPSTLNIPKNVLTEDDIPSILSWQIGTNSQGNPITLQDWIRSQIPEGGGSGGSSSGEGSGTVDIQLELKHMILNELGVVDSDNYQGGLFDTLPSFLENKGTFTGFQTKENLVTDLNAKLYDSNGNLIGTYDSNGNLIGDTTLARALSGLNKLNGALIDSNGNVKGFITQADLDSTIQAIKGGSDAQANANVSTWAARVWDEGKKLWTNAAGWKLSSFIKALAVGPGEQTSADGVTDYNKLIGPEIIGTINENEGSKLQISAGKIDIAGIVTIINDPGNTQFKINADKVDIAGIVSIINDPENTQFKINADQINIDATHQLNLTADQINLDGETIFNLLTGSFDYQVPVPGGEAGVVRLYNYVR